MLEIIFLVILFQVVHKLPKCCKQFPDAIESLSEIHIHIEVVEIISEAFYSFDRSLVDLFCKQISLQFRKGHEWIGH